MVLLAKAIALRAGGRARAGSRAAGLHFGSASGTSVQEAQQQGTAWLGTEQG